MAQQIFPAGVYPLSGDVTSTAGVATVAVTGIQTTPVAPTAPGDGQVLIYNQLANQYAPGDPIVSGPDAVGAPATRNPVQVGGEDEGNYVRELRTDTYGSLRALTVEELLSQILLEIRALKAAVLALDPTLNDNDFDADSFDTQDHIT